MSLSVERFLTIISLSIAILGALGAFTWRITRMLNKLLDLPGEVREVVDELKDMNQQIGEIRGEASQWRKVHLERDHQRSIRRRGEKGI